jgi:hypothetical protein
MILDPTDDPTTTPHAHRATGGVSRATTDEHLRCLCVKDESAPAPRCWHAPPPSRCQGQHGSRPASRQRHPPVELKTPSWRRAASSSPRLARDSSHDIVDIVDIVDIAPNDIAPNRILTLTAAEPSARSARPAGVRARGGRPTRLPGPGPRPRASRARSLQDSRFLCLS